MYGGKTMILEKIVKSCNITEANQPFGRFAKLFKPKLLYDVNSPIAPRLQKIAFTSGASIAC
jgi:hypothetical protein